MASCVRNIRTKNYPNLIIGFQVTVENVKDVFGTQCRVFQALDGEDLAILACTAF